MYNIDLSILIGQLLPTFLRTTVATAWLTALLAPLQWFVDNTWNASVLEFQDKVKYNGQIIYLERILNQRYNSGSTGIYLLDVADIEYFYLYNKSEGVTTKYMYNASEAATPQYLYNWSEIATQVDFIVMIPAALYTMLSTNNQLPNVTALVTYYKIAGTRFTIQSY